MTRGHDVNGVDYSTNATTERDTGLLTRFVPASLKQSALYRWFLRLTRVLQFLSSTISLALFSRRIHKLNRLVNSLKTARGIPGSHGAVEGILAAAVLYTFIAMLLSLLKKGGGSTKLRWLLVLLDLLFVAAFIAVAVITRPNGGGAGPRRCYSDRTIRDDSCRLPWGTFISAIAST